MEYVHQTHVCLTIKSAPSIHSLFIKGHIKGSHKPVHAGTRHNSVIHADLSYYRVGHTRTMLYRHFTGSGRKQTNWLVSFWPVIDFLPAPVGNMTHPKIQGEPRGQKNVGK